MGPHACATSAGRYLSRKTLCACAGLWLTCEFERCARMLSGPSSVPCRAARSSCWGAGVHAPPFHPGHRCCTAATTALLCCHRERAGDSPDMTTGDDEPSRLARPVNKSRGRGFHPSAAAVHPTSKTLGSVRTAKPPRHWGPRGRGTARARFVVSMSDSVHLY